jgi:cellulose synthase/poly-beta-1,6-N-acetylglucosamine synthase-like glycosyltransferase
MPLGSNNGHNVISVSIIIPSYNARFFIQRCLQSVVSQAEVVGAEVIVVDSSTDGTEQVIAQSLCIKVCYSTQGFACEEFLAFHPENKYIVCAQ